MRDVLEIFKENEMFSKEELLRSVGATIEHIKKDKQFNRNEEVRKVWVELFRKFEGAIQESYLPKLRGDWWFYSYQVMFDRIDLELCKAEDIKVGQDGEIDGMTMVVAEVILSIECDYVTISEFAELQGVSVSTASKWLHQGRLRNATKNDDEWLIPSIEQRPPTMYKTTYYTIYEVGEIEIPNFPLASFCSDIQIEQNKKNKKQFDCLFINHKSDFQEMLQLTLDEVAQLEYELIASGKAGESCYYSPIPHIGK